MPFKKEMNNLFYFGIQQPANEANFICERTDEESTIYTGDILTQIKKKNRVVFFGNYYINRL